MNVIFVIIWVIIFQYFRRSVDFNLRSSDALFSLYFSVIFSQSSFILFTYNSKNIFIIIGFMFIVHSSTSMIKVPCISAVKVNPRLYFVFKFWKDSFLFAECIFWTSFKQVLTNTCNMLVLAKFSERMMIIYIGKCIKNMPTWNHVNKDEVKRSRTAFVFTLTSFITSMRNMIKILFLQHSSLVQAYRRLQAKSKKSFKHFASPKGLDFSSKFKRKSGWGNFPP